jgi:hypothetical protein
MFISKAAGRDVYLARQRDDVSNNEYPLVSSSVASLLTIHLGLLCENDFSAARD